MDDIFISYSHRDVERAQKIATLLRSQGWSVWYDERIRAGTEFDQEIEQALAKAKCVVVVWSQDSCQSSWVRAEAEEALEAQKLVPICVDPNAEIPLRFRQIQTAMIFDFERQSDALQRFLSDVRYMIKPEGAPATPTPLPTTSTELMIVPGKWNIETKVLKGLIKGRCDLNLKPNGDAFGSGKAGPFGGDVAGQWRFDDTDARLYLNMTGPVGTEMWTIKLTERIKEGFKGVDNQGRQTIVKRTG